MKLKITLAALILGPLLLTGCGKKEAPAEAGAEQVATTEATTVTAEQQAAIDAIDQPVMDENNTDVPAEVANAEPSTAQAAASGAQ
jgi:outer membrane murein-binding lipoprotein Lpp